jgi:hypothetical protein
LLLIGHDFKFLVALVADGLLFGIEIVVVTGFIEMPGLSPDFLNVNVMRICPRDRFDVEAEPPGMRIIGKEFGLIGRSPPIYYAGP